jgi:hypothetical protein
MTPQTSVTPTHLSFCADKLPDWWPGGRSDGVSWVTDGKLWMFGGYGLGEDPNVVGYLNDMWSYDPSQNLWVFLGGSQSVNPQVRYSPKFLLHDIYSFNRYPPFNTPVNYFPPARRGVAGFWTSGSTVWIYGGEGLPHGNPSSPFYNDIWRWDGLTWTWIGGSSATGVPPVHGTL